MYSVNLNKEAKKEVADAFTSWSFAIYREGPLPSTSEEVDFVTYGPKFSEMVNIYNSVKQIDRVKITETPTGVGVNETYPVKSHWPCVYDVLLDKWSYRPDSIILESLVGNEIDDIFTMSVGNQFDFINETSGYVRLTHAVAQETAFEYVYDNPVAIDSCQLRNHSTRSCYARLEYHDGTDWVLIQDFAGLLLSNDGLHTMEFTEVTASRFRFVLKRYNSDIFMYVMKLLHTNAIAAPDNFTPTSIQFFPGTNAARPKDWGLNDPWFMVEAGGAGSGKAARLTQPTSIYNGDVTGVTAHVLDCNFKVDEVPDAL